MVARDAPGDACDFLWRKGRVTALLVDRLKDRSNDVLAEPTMAQIASQASKRGVSATFLDRLTDELCIGPVAV